MCAATPLMERILFKCNCELTYLAQYKVPIGTIRVDKQCKLHVIDLICAFCQLKRKIAAQILRRLLARKQIRESDITVHTYHPSEETKKISMASHANAIRLIMVLP